MKKKIFVRGPMLSQSGYGEQARFAVRALRSREDIYDIYLQPIRWGETGWVWEDNEFRRWMDSRIAETAGLIQNQQFNPDISLQITIPNEFQKMAPVNVGYTAGIETTNVAPEWLAKANEMTRLVVISEHAKSGFVNTTATAKNTETGEEHDYRVRDDLQITPVNYAVRNIELEDIAGLDFKYDFNFLVVSQMGPRKNMENTIRWWVEEFIDQEVGLVVKTAFKGNSEIDREYTFEYLKKILQAYPERKCTVNLLHGDLSEGQMWSLYNHDKIKAFVNIAHGEGFGLPIFEAAQCGLPVVTIPWSGQLDFLEQNGKRYFTEVDYDLQAIQPHAVWKGVLEEGTMWAYADQGSYKMALRKVRTNWKEAKAQANELKEILLDKYTEEKQYAAFCEAVYTPTEEELEWIEKTSEIEIL